MKYIIDVYRRSHPGRVATTTDVFLTNVTKDMKCSVCDLFKTHYLRVNRDVDIESYDEYEDWISQLEYATSMRREALMNEEVPVVDVHEALLKEKVPSVAKDHVKPPHYDDFFEGTDLQWLDTESRKPRYRDPEQFIAAVELQVRKYLERNGRKDDVLQEYKKGFFYYAYIITYMENGCRPIKAVDVHDWLRKLPKY